MSRAFKTFQKGEWGYRYVNHEPNKIIYGDTDSSYIDLSHLFDPDAKPEEVIPYADSLGSFVNSQFPQFMRDVFNVTEERINIIQTDREVVSDRSFFATKKKYAMHVINKEGITVDETKVMGMEIKKSSTQKIVQQFLSKMIDMIMRGVPYPEIKVVTEEFKEDFMTRPIEDIGIPTTINTITKYEDAIEENNVEAMKKTPYHARATLWYNSMCGVSDTRIRTGDKIKIIYIKHPDTKYIAIPSDAAELPKFIEDLTIDRETHWEKATKTIGIYLKAASLDKKSRQRTMHNNIGITFS